MRKWIAMTAVFVIFSVPLLASAANSSELLDHPIVQELQEGQQQGTSTFDHSTYDALVSRHANPDAATVDYAGLARERDRLNDYLQSIADVDLTRLGGDEQHALLINLYNACTLDLILDHYPGIDSIRDISSPWDTERCEVGGHRLTLDEVEHNLIRPMFKDPRIHFAVNCAAVDCPPLADFAYTGDQLDDQLQRRTEAVLSSEKYVRIQQRRIFSDRIRYTRVMHWYEDDFVNPEFQDHAPDVATYIVRNTNNEEIKQFYRDHDGDPSISALGYDWALNDAP